MSKIQLSVGEPAEEADEDAEAAAPVEAKPGAKRKKKLIIVGVAALLLLGGGGAAAWTMLGGKDDHAAAPVADAAAIYVEAPPMTVNLRTADGQARYLKLRVVFSAASATEEERIKARMPAILDAYQPFLRELRPDDLSGSAAAFRIKEELLVRATGILGAGIVKDVLIQDLVQQ